MISVILLYGQNRSEGIEYGALDTVFFKLLCVVFRKSEKATHIVINQSHSYALRGFSLQNFQDAVPHNAFLHDEIFQKYVLLGFFKC